MARKPRQSGVALLLVLILVASASVLGFSYVTRSTMKLASSNNLVQVSRARYLAESGLFHGLDILRYEPSAMFATDVTPLGPYTIGNSSDSYTVGSSLVAGQVAQYWMVGRGTVYGITQSIVMKVQFDSYYNALLMGMEPEHYWRLGEMFGVLAFDSQGSQTGIYRNGVILGGVGGIVHDSNKAARFDGVDDHVNMGDLKIRKDAVSLVAWVHPLAGVEDYARIISKSTGTGSTDTYWQLAIQQVGVENRLRFRLRAGGVTQSLIAGSGDAKTGQWTFAVATYDKGDRMRLYHNGVEVGNCAQTGDTNKGDGVDVWVGGDPTGPESRPWKGSIDEVAIFRRALTPVEIMTLYKARIPDVRVLSWDN